MKIRILGTGTSVPSLRRHSSSFLIEAEGKRIIVDVGPSIVRRLLEIGYHVFDIDVIILTHFHLDHSADFPTFLFTCNYGLRARTEPLTILGGDGIKKFVSTLERLYPWIRPRTYNLSIFPLKNKVFSLGNLFIEAKSVNHNKESIAIKMSIHNKSIVISGDTDYSRNLVDLSRNCNLLIAECSFPERKVSRHMNLQILSKIVGKAKPHRVILTHLYPEWDAYERPLPASFIVGMDGMEIDL